MAKKEPRKYYIICVMSGRRKPDIKVCIERFMKCQAYLHWFRRSLLNPMPWLFFLLPSVCFVVSLHASSECVCCLVWTVAWLGSFSFYTYTYFTPRSLSIEQIAVELLVCWWKQTRWCRRNVLHSKSSEIIFIKCCCYGLIERYGNGRFTTFASKRQWFPSKIVDISKAYGCTSGGCQALDLEQNAKIHLYIACFPIYPYPLSFSFLSALSFCLLFSFVCLFHSSSAYHKMLTRKMCAQCSTIALLVIACRVHFLSLSHTDTHTRGHPNENIQFYWIVNSVV